MTLQIPQIQPVVHGTQRPFWSVMIPTYNCARYLPETLRSVLQQDPGPELMQIEIVDDCSTQDDPQPIVEEIGRGRVLFFRQPQNVGATRNFNTCIKRACGKWIHILHGDDYVSPEFYAQVEQNIREKDRGIFSCRSLIIDAASQVHAVSPRLSVEGDVSDVQPLIREWLTTSPFRTPGMVVARSSYENLGGFAEILAHVADLEMWIRVFDREGGVVTNKPLAFYRESPGNDTSRLVRTGDNLRDYLRLAEILALRYPAFDYADFRKQISRRALQQAIAFYASHNQPAMGSNARLWWESSNPKDRFAPIVDVLRTLKMFSCVYKSIFQIRRI